MPTDVHTVPTAAPTTCPVTLWRKLTLKANALFIAGDVGAALEGYECAQTLVLTHFSAWTAPDDAVAAAVVSHLNLSEALACLGSTRQAADVLCSVHRTLLATMDDAGLAPALRTAAHRHLSDTFAALTRFQSHYGPCDEVAEWLRAGCPCAHCAAPALDTSAIAAHALLPSPSRVQ